MSLAVGNIISPILGGALVEAGDKKDPEYKLNQAFGEVNADGSINDEIWVGGGFPFAANVMAMVTLAVLVLYGTIGWFFRPKSNFEKMQSGEEGHTFDEIVFGQDHEPKKLFGQGRFLMPPKGDKGRTGSFNIANC